MGCGSAPGTCIWAALVDGGHARRSRSACRISQTGVLSPFRPLYLRQPATFSLLIGANHGITGGAPRDTYERYPISVQPNRRANAPHRSARRKGPRAQLACPPARRRDRTADGPPAPSARAGDHPPSHGGPGCAVRLVARRRATRPSAPGRAGPRSPTLSLAEGILLRLTNGSGRSRRFLRRWLPRRMPWRYRALIRTSTGPFFRARVNQWVMQRDVAGESNTRYGKLLTG